MALSKWRSFNEWHFQKKLGSGGFGEVLLWRNASTGQSVATKHIREPISLGADQQIKLHERWQKEYNWTREFPDLDSIVSGLRLEEKHLEFVQYLNRTHACKLPVIILEYCDGGDVRKRLQLPENANGLCELEVRRILGSMRNALDFLHFKCKVCHRDLKPDNIVIQRGRNGEKVYKLTDFGLARQSPDQTMLQSVVGTRHYFAPEVLETGKYNKSVDYWSLGIIAYELSTGTLPFIPHQTPRVILQQLLLKKDQKYIAITEDPVSNQFKFHTKLPLEHKLTPCWAEQLEQWLPLALETDYRKRAATDEVQLPIVFKKLDEILQIKVLTIFVISNYKRLAYIISHNMNMVDLSLLISSDTGIPQHLVYFILPTGHPHKTLTLTTRPSDLYVEDWLHNSHETKHPPVMLYVVHAIDEGTLQAAEPKISNSMKYYNTPDFRSNQSWVMQHFWLVVHHFASTEQENLELLLLGLREYAMFLQDVLMQYRPSIDNLIEQRLKAAGAYEFVKRHLQIVGTPPSLEWLKLEEKCRVILDTVDRAKSHYLSNVSNSKEKEDKTLQLCKTWVKKDAYNVTSLQQIQGRANELEELKNHVINTAIKRDKFLKHAEINNLYTSLLKLNVHYIKLVSTLDSCHKNLKESQDILHKMLGTLMPQVQPESPAVFELSSLMNHLSVDISVNSFEDSDTDELIKDSLRLERLMRGNMETDQV
ncbi:inhibitor of nuclear factor kappa-B kinase subunit beta [Drosophila tropicalis]|uniref:inhibitor of nuclear factor kappa-B kinase subunit beta n=1 Tax=Drosophila tropicalis TaxID=46794 RepID=UPI0035ABC932